MTSIINAGRNAWQQVHAEASGLLVDAADYYVAVYRAISGARSSVLMSGWQFDSGVQLLRGAEEPAGGDVRFLKFLDRLCRRRPELRVYILAWDFNMVFAGEREWFQRVYFHWMTASNLQFRVDDHPVAGGSHHQKFVVVDGGLTFLGGMDVCEGRWDDRRHRADNPLRVSRGQPHKPYHDVQAWLTGREPARALEDLFSERWRRAGGPPLDLREAHRPDPPGRGSLPVAGTAVALSRTDPRPDGKTIREVGHLFEDAIAAAERLIYIETQYFSSRRIREALIRRMRAPGRPRPQIVIVVNEQAEALKEELAVGLRQARNLEVLRETAAASGCALGCYFSLCEGAGEMFRATYIHSKLMIVDDRFLTVGSANLTNRSLGLDSELHVAWEDARDSGALVDSIRDVRVGLLAEHAGLARTAADLVAIDGLVARLDALAERAEARLKHLPRPTPAQRTAMRVVEPDDLPFDPEMSDADDAARFDPSDEGRARRRMPIAAAVLGGVGTAVVAGLVARYIRRAR